MNTGGCVSVTVTLKRQLAWLLWASRTVHSTVVVPFGKIDPEAGLQTGTSGESGGICFTPGAAVAPQLSITVGAGYVTIAVHLFGSVGLITVAGHVIAGGCVSLIVTVKEHGVELVTFDLGGAALPGDTEQVTVVVPRGKSEPGAGTQLIVLQSPVVMGA